MSKFTDTDMIRVIEDEEDNYLRNLEDNDKQKALSRPFSTTQKGSIMFNANLEKKQGRKLTDERINNIQEE